MQFYLARSFQKALRKLDHQSQAQAKQAALEFQMDPSQPGFRFHRINGARDAHMWSFRVGRDLRIIVHHHGGRFSLCYVDHHDAAYAWAERHRVEEHPTTGALQLIEVIEREEVVTREVESTVVLPPLASLAPEQLLRLGVPADWVDWALTASEEVLLEQLDELPEAVGLRLFELMTGGNPSPPPQRDEVEPEEHPDAAREFVRIESPRTLEQALGAPWESWLVFLHPEQRALVGRRFDGPARVHGSAGTGKTVVALHRAVELARRDPAARVLLTTFTRVLCQDLERRLTLLLGEGAPELERIEVRNIHGVARGLHRGGFQACDDETLWALVDEAIAAHPRVLESFDVDYVRSEWRAVIDPYQIGSSQAYFATSARGGRNRALGRREKLRLWDVFGHVLTALEARGQGTWRGLCAGAASWLEGHPEERPYDHVVVDEAQDFTHAELRLVRQLAAPGEDDLFLVGDAGQRLYSRPVDWASAGVEVAGREVALTVNYRTTEQIRVVGEELLPGALPGPGGEAERREARSVRHGDPPVVKGFATEEEEVEALAGWLTALVVERGYALEDVAVFARTWELVARAERACARAGVAHGRIRGGALPAEGVRLGTMHGSKGLEFRAVAVIACDGAHVPLKKRFEYEVADKEDAATILDQERNLLYVASTRGRDQLFISYAGAPSPFLRALMAADGAPGVTSRPAPEAATAPARVERPKPADTRVRALVEEEAEEATAEASRGGEGGGEPPVAEPPPRGEGARSEYRISPSRVAQHFRFSCARQLRYSAAWSRGRRAAEGVPEGEARNRLGEAILRSGFEWEARVLTGLLGDSVVHVAPGEGPLTERSWAPEESVERLRALGVGEYLYQPTLRAPRGFYARYGIDARLVTVSDNRPDLLWVVEGEGGGRELRVVDMKRGASVRVIHRIQLLMYALELEALCQAEGIDDLRVETGWGWVWLGDHARPTRCDLSGLRPHLERFLGQELGAILTAPPSEVAWHVNYRCEWCPWLGHCWEEMEARDDVSRVPGLTHRGKAYLREQGVETVSALRRLLEREGGEEVLAGCASLAGQRHQLGPRSRALVEGEVVAQGAMARGLTLETRREVLVFLTLQREALGGEVYLLGYRVACGAEVPDGVVVRHDDEREALLVAEGPGEGEALGHRFIVELYALLSRVDAYNLGQAWGERLSVQFFVYSAADQALLSALLFEALGEPATARAAETLLLYFQGPDLILASRRPDVVAFPMTVLLNVLGRVLALPIPVSYTLPESLEALGVSSGRYPRDARFHLPLSPTLRSERVHEAWHHGDEEALVETRAHAGRHLEALESLLRATRGAASRQLHLYPPKLSLPRAARIRSALLSRLGFFAQYESALACTDVRDSRMVARRAVRQSERVHELEARGDGWYALVGGDAYRLEASGYANWLLARDTVEGRRAQIRYNDFYHRARWDGGGRAHEALAVARVAEVERDGLGFVSAARLDLKRPFSGEAPREGERLLLYERFTDSLMSRQLDFLGRLDEGPRGLFLRLLERPAGLRRAAPWPEGVSARLDRMVEGLSLTGSQQEALAHLRGSRVLALWGPPGTGKTHFLATMILALLEAHREAGRPFRVMVTAFTHAAVENVLRKVASVNAERSIWSGEATPVAKVGEWRGEGRPRGVTVEGSKAQAPAWVSGRSRAVLGGTIWGFDKHFEFGAFDLVVVDEASQVKVPEAAIAVTMANAEEGRVVFAGDHRQLPPIVRGEYPTDEGEEAPLVLHRSIFEAVCQLEGGCFERQLQENFRMNDVLTSLSARLLYGPRYRCGSAEVEARRLRLGPLEGEGALVQECLSPERSMVVALFRGGPSGRDSEAEAALVAELTTALRGSLLDEGGARYASDAAFFKEGVFIISPHHSQLHRIRRRLQAAAPEGAWTSPPFADTVDKMQGQEAQVVLVSYGVSDPEFAAREASFIYSLNRLNVAITRAQRKTVLMLPEALLDAAPEVFEDDEAAEGLAYMRSLVEHVRAGQEASVFLRGGGVEVEVYGLSAPLLPTP